MSREPSARLRQGRRDLEGIPGVKLLEDFVWNDVVRKWAIRVRLTREGPESRYVPRETDWYILTADDYPWGKLKFCPASKDSITATFHHQEYNRPYPDDRPWTMGELCLNSTVNILGRHGLEDEPFDASGPRGRMRWHALRAKEWLRLAAADELANEGDPFELPHFPGAILSDTTVVHAEDTGSYRVWDASSITYGSVKLVPLDAKPSILAVTGFYTLPGQLVLDQRWGSNTLSGTSAERGCLVCVSINI